MMHLAYPNVSNKKFQGCVRYASLQAPDSSYTLASPNTLNLDTIRAVTLRLAREWLDWESYKVPIYEKADAPGDWQGSSLDLAYLLASIRCVRTLRLEALEDAGDIWCTGAIGALESGAPRLKMVDLAQFERKLAGFFAQPHDRLFLVPAAHLHYELYQRCQAHAVQVLPLSTFRQALPEALAARRWATKTVVLIDDVQLPLLVATLFEQPFPAAEPEAEEMLRRPYRFLAAFEGKDADLFSGREREIRQLQSLLPRARVLILHGASGTGKTSLLQAGLLPRLPPAQYAWVRVRVVDDEPTRAIKAAMIGQLGLDPRLQDRPLVDFLHAAATAVGKSVVVILDQFEEFFLRFPLTVRQGFHHDLGACVTAADLAVHVLIALREDYLARLAEFQD
ncbi:MAG: ATP-binding protein, partial [Nitrospinae bacterium]|nr:ATP-binding protein [Nitrospinota bacterium]